MSPSISESPQLREKEGEGERVYVYVYVSVCVPTGLRSVLVLNPQILAEFCLSWCGQAGKRDTASSLK